MNGENGKDCPIFGQIDYKDPQGLPVDYKALKKQSIEGFQTMDKFIVNILSPDNYKVLKRMYNAKKWDISSSLWVKVLYDFIFAYETSENMKDIVEALKPLYFARATSFYRQTLDMSHEESEDEIVSQAKEFKKSKGYLAKRYELEMQINL